MTTTYCRIRVAGLVQPPERRTKLYGLTRPGAGSPRAREDRDLNCSTWPFTALRTALPTVCMSGAGHGNVARPGSVTGTLYALPKHGLRLTLARQVTLVTPLGGPTGGSGRRLPRRRGFVRGPGASRGHRGL